MSLNDARVIYPVREVHASCIIDGHMHINSGACAPLPLLYEKVEAKAAGADVSGVPVVQTRESLEIAMKAFGYIDGINMQRLSTEEMGKRIAHINLATYYAMQDSTNFGKEIPPFAEIDSEDNIIVPEKQISSPMIVMTMDMERAHIAGYQGSLIYHGEEEGLFFYKRFSGKLPEERGKQVSLAHEWDKSNGLKLHQWEKQYNETRNCAKNHPFHVIPLYFYDPRRWNRSQDETIPPKIQNNLEYGRWNDPFKDVAVRTHPGVFLGFKMYPSLGHKPFDELCEYLPEYYHKCQNERIPILTHCSPGGMITHEIEFYKEFDEASTVLRQEMKFKQTQKLLSLRNSGSQPVITSQRFVLKPVQQTSSQEQTIIDPKSYFLENYVSPKAWEPVLENFPDLRLCLAHFGGDEWRQGTKIDWLERPPSRWVQGIVDLTKKYRNVYTDISCFDLANKLYRGKDTVRSSLVNYLGCLRKPDRIHLRDKIIFGTDWYLTMITRTSGGAYGEYCRIMKKFLDSIDHTLWVRFTLVNPWEFYGLGNEIKLNQLKIGLIAAKASETEVDRKLDRLKRINEEVQKLKEKYARWDKEGW